MKHYTTLHPLFLSFYSKDLYRHVGKNWKGISFLYLLLLLALSWIPIIGKMHGSVSAYLANEAPKIVNQVPVITISHGEVSVNEEMPYIITFPEDGTPLIIIDTTGEYTSLDNSEAYALLTKTEFIVKKDETDTRAFDLSQFGSLVIDRNTIYGWLETFEQWFAIVLYPFMLLFSYIYRVIQVLLYAALGLIFARNLKADLDYQALLSVAIVSITPVIIINTLYNYSDLSVPFWWLICFLIAMGYLYFGVKANAEEENPAVKFQ